MSGNCDDPTKRSGKAGVRTNPAKNKPVTSTSIHGRNTAGNHGGYSSSNSEQSNVGQNIPRGSDNSSDFDVWVVPNISGRYNLSFYKVLHQHGLLEWK
jgi:hypothetical protein